MKEWGIFNDEGLVESQCWSRDEALRRIAESYSDDDEVVVYEICPDHEGFPADNYEECDNEDEDEDES